MKKNKILETLAIKTGIKESDIENLFMNYMMLSSVSLRKEGEIELPFFGVFRLKRLPARRRQVKDFSTMKQVFINMPAEDKLSFRAFKDALRLIYGK